MQETDKLGIIHSYNDSNELISEEFSFQDEKLVFIYQNNVLKQIDSNDVTLFFDTLGNIVSVHFNDGIIANYFYKHHKFIFMNENGLVLGNVFLNIAPIESSKNYFFVKKIVNQLVRAKSRLVLNNYRQRLLELDEEISSLNELIVEDACQILSQKNRFVCKQLLKNLDKKEAKCLKRNANNRKKVILKYSVKRDKVRKMFEYERELEILKSLQNKINLENSRLNSLILKRHELESKVNF